VRRVRRVLHGDVAAVARAVSGLPRAARARRIAGLIAAAEAAEAHRLRCGQAHPLWGTGSLMAATSGMAKGDEPDFDDDAYCAAWIAVLAALIRHRRAARAA